MKSHVNEHILPASPRFHLLQSDGLYRPISFFLVTERMRREIEDERQLILEGTAPALRARQAKLFARYDPKRSERTFKDVLRIFGGSGHS